MLVLPTGAGKSLCYQLTALILPGLTLVVSPLVALMVDQLRQLPPSIPGGILSSSQTNEESSETLRLLCEGHLKSETDQISKYLYDNNITAKSYHSGIPASHRSRTQELFCSNKIRVVVATVAFGMGLDKSDVGAVIHYSLPESIEEYMQENGRAGRDGRLSHCHLLLDDNTYYKLRSLSYSDGVDEYTINKFLCQIFNNDTNVLGDICSLVKESASRKFDMKEELELGETQYVRLLPQLNVTCTLHFHKTSPGLLSDKDMLVAMILKKSETKQGHYVFDIPTIANCVGVTTIDVSNQLLKLKLSGEITYELKDPSFCYVIAKKPEDMCSLATYFTRWLSDVESHKVRKLDAMFKIARFAATECRKDNGCSDSLHTSCMNRNISDYFSGGCDVLLAESVNKMSKSSPFLRADIKIPSVLTQLVRAITNIIRSMTV
ncbi:ATP-dependent DNA helicase Q-like 5 [Acorus calamus]|uniref:DNA 3'-5' helicase n=1 Tax=Acorus calamus TaxID=4465 RepID=A0AAV9CZI7_ACOCL|nr:ATP-dependent DNA helicase Q-like 5 [Acorus calamus]